MQINNVLLVDIGNTRIKFRLLSEASDKITTVDDLSALITYIEAASISHVFVANVGKPAVEDALAQLCLQQKIIF